jgi:hypothetical protein
MGKQPHSPSPFKDPLPFHSRSVSKGFPLLASPVPECYVGRELDVLRAERPGRPGKGAFP